MKNKKDLKNQILYRSTHRGTKEMDMLLGRFVKKYINELNDKDLLDLDEILNYDDEILFKWYFNRSSWKIVQENRITRMLRSFKL